MEENWKITHFCRLYTWYDDTRRTTNDGQSQKRRCYALTTHKNKNSKQKIVFDSRTSAYCTSIKRDHHILSLSAAEQKHAHSQYTAIHLQRQKYQYWVTVCSREAELYRHNTDDKPFSFVLFQSDTTCLVMA